jgi:hypothetical protein
MKCKLILTFLAELSVSSLKVSDHPVLGCSPLTCTANVKKIVRRFTVDTKTDTEMQTSTVNGIHGQSARQTDKQAGRQAY